MVLERTDCRRAEHGLLVNPAVLSFFANDTLLGTKTTSSLGEWEPWHELELG